MNRPLCSFFTILVLTSAAWYLVLLEDLLMFFPKKKPPLAPSPFQFNWTRFQPDFSVLTQPCGPFDRRFLYLPRLWLVEGQFYSDALNETVHVCSYHGNDIEVRPNTSLAVPPNVSEVVSLIRYRIHPGAFAHEIRDNLALNTQILFYFFGDENLPSQQVFLDGQHVPLPRELQPVSESRLRNAYYPHACLGSQMPGLFPVASWAAVARVFGARLGVGGVQRDAEPLVWFANRNFGAAREILNPDEIEAELRRRVRHWNASRPGLMPLAEQVCFFEKVRVSKHFEKVWVSKLFDSGYQF